VVRQAPRNNAAAAMATRARLLIQPATAAARGRPRHGPQAHRIVASGRPEAAIRDTSRQRPKQPRRHLPTRACPHGRPGLGRERASPSLRLNAATGHRMPGRTQTRWASAAAPRCDHTKRPRRWAKGPAGEPAHTDQRRRHNCNEQGERQKQDRRQRQPPSPFGQAGGLSQARN